MHPCPHMIPHLGHLPLKWSPSMSSAPNMITFHVLCPSYDGFQCPLPLVWSPTKSSPFKWSLPLPPSPHMIPFHAPYHSYEPLTCPSTRDRTIGILCYRLSLYYIDNITIINHFLNKQLWYDESIIFFKNSLYPSHNHYTSSHCFV